ncbi:MAG: prephenate dehydratase [Alphaproteobacteria bacterium]|nr:prephenate dehydratase [Alphaproteobacteria bacterium]
MLIAFQGAYGANSHLACQKFYPALEAKAFASFLDVFAAVEKGEAAFGMIPLENSYAGRVAEIHNLLQKHYVSIVAEHFLPITHNLVGLGGARLEDIKEVYSHPQALMQCQENLRSLGVRIVESSNTAQAAKYIASQGDKNKAAICSKLAADLYGLSLIKENLQDSGNDNVTVFIVIAKEALEIDPQVAPVITALLFTIRNIPGALYKALGGFATNGVSMVKLESYIPGGVSKQAQFFISIEGHPSQKPVALALEELGFFSKQVKLLGVYYADKARAE